MSPAFFVILAANALTLLLVVKWRGNWWLVLGQSTTVTASLGLLWLYGSDECGKEAYENAALLVDVGCSALEMWIGLRLYATGSDDCSARSLLMIAVVSHQIAKIGWHWDGIPFEWPGEILTALRRGINLLVMFAVTWVAYSESDATASGEGRCLAGNRS